DEKLEEMANQMRRNGITIAEISKAVEFNSAEIKDCKEKCLEMSKSVRGLTAALNNLESRTSELEGYKRRWSLRINGMKERSEEDPRREVFDLIAEIAPHLMQKLDDIIDTVHRIEVMNVVIQIVNKIMEKGLNHRQFRLLMYEVVSTYSDLLLHNKVRWLSRGEVLKRFAACLEEVKSDLGSKGLTFLELEQPAWLEKLHFMVDMTAHLNTLNTTLQGKGGTAHMLEEVLAFERKLTVFVRDLQR
ncbi:hypothetical protein QTP86_019619, partial [Hemibagrus guttatus]